MYGSQEAEAYSKCSLSKEVKAGALTSEEQTLIFLRRRLSTRVALADTAATCSCHIRPEDTVTSRYVKDSTDSRVMLPMGIA